jgi:D-sedoheptulose 7-phosphate isomerase
MKHKIEKIFQDSIDTKKKTIAENVDKIVRVVEAIHQSLNKGGKVLFFGNGGSAADSQHIAAEFIGRFQKERKSLAAIALTTDSSILTAIGNDYGFDVIFARQIEGLGNAGDIAFGISTSGNSKNVLEGLKQAKRQKLITIGLLGNAGGAIASLVDIAIIVSSTNTARVQESHICIYHAICEMVEEYSSPR